MRILIIGALIFIAGCKSSSQPQYEHKILPASKTNSSPVEIAEQQTVKIELTDGKLTLQQATAATLLHNPRLKAYDLDRRISEARQIQAMATPNPELEMEVENFGGTGDFSGLDSAEVSLQLSQIIELGGKLEKRKKIASLDSDIAEQSYNAAKLQILAELTTAYIDAAKMQKMVDISQELLQWVEQSHEMLARKVAAGVGSDIDLKRAAMELSSAKMRHNELLLDFERTKTSLSSFWAAEQVRFEGIEANFQASTKLPDFDKLKQKLNENPQLLLLKTEIEKNKAAIDIERANSMPDITIGGGIKYDNDTDDKAFIVGVSIPLPITNTNRGQRLEATHNLAKTHQLKRQQQIELQNVFNEISSSLINSSTKAMELENNILPQAREILNGLQNAHRRAAITYWELLDARKSYLENQAEYIEAISEYQKSMVLIHTITGQKPNTTNFNR